MKVEIFPSSQLAGAQDSINGLMTGSVDLSIYDAAYLVSIMPQYQAIILPFMFRSLTSLYRVLDGPIGNQYFADLDAKGIVGLMWGGGEVREVETTSKVIATPADMKGMRFRIHGGPDIPTMQALGAIPVSIAYTETYVALRQNTIDGIEIGLEGVASAKKLHEVLKHVAMSNHVISIAPLLCSKKKLQTLPPDLQKMVRGAALSVRGAWRARYDARTEEAMQTLKSNGVAFNDIDYPAFRKAMDPVYATYESKLGADFIQRVSRAAAAS